jgi:chromosome segregation ATPase
VTEGWKSIRLTEFEHVVTGPFQSLLRVNGRASRRSSSGPRPVLVMGVPPDAHRFAPLRAPEDRGRVLHAAYAVPTAQVQSGAPCWLEFEDGFQIELPTPEEGTARMRDGQVAEAPAATEMTPEGEAPTSTEAMHEAEVPPEGWPAAEGFVAPAQQTQADAQRTGPEDELFALRQRIAELERARDDDQRVATSSAAQIQTRLETAEQRADTAERELESAQQRADTVERELESAQVRVQAAEQQTQTFETRAQAAETQSQLALARAEAAQGEAASAASQLAALESRAGELEHKAQRQKARIETLEHDLAEVAPAREALEREVTKLRGSQSSLKHELDQARDKLRMMTLERDELSRQAAAYDAVAVKARDRAAQAEDVNEKTTATLRELQIWRGELERRLAETTSELGAARAAREADERELQRLRATLAEHDQAPVRTNGDDHSETVAAQAEEIEHLASELAALRARFAREA